MRKPKNLLINLSISLITIFFILILGEIAIRSFTNISPPLTVRNLKIGKTYRKNISKEIFAPESEKKVFLKFNNEGFRGSTRPIAKNDNTIRIAILGDSQIAAINNNEEDTFVVLLQKKLNRLYPKMKWEVFNFGVSGASTAQEFNLYKKVVKKYDMDVVVCAYTNANDFSDNSMRLSWNPRIYMDFKDDSDDLTTLYLNPTKKFSIWLNENSMLYVWQKLMMNHAISNFISAGAAGKNNMIRGGALIFVNDPKDDDLVYSWKLNEKLIQEFNDTVTDDGSLFIFLSIPNRIELLEWQWEEFQSIASGTKYEGKIEQNHPHNKLYSIVKRHGIRHLFLRYAFEAHTKGLSRNNPRYYFSYKSGSGHLNEIGNILMTNAFYKYLDKTGIIKKLIETNIDAQQRDEHGFQNAGAF